MMAINASVTEKRRKKAGKSFFLATALGDSSFRELAHLRAAVPGCHRGRLTGLKGSTCYGGDPVATE